MQYIPSNDDSFTDGILITDLDLHITSYNLAIIKIFNYSENELPSDFEMLISDLFETKTEGENLRDLIKTVRSEQNWSGSLQFSLNGHKELYLKSTPAFTQKTGVMGRIWVFRDVSKPQVMT